MVYDTMTQLIGNTPLLKLNRYICKNVLAANVFAKIEYFNPAGSIKDRAALYMIEDAEKRGLLFPDCVIIEPTSGNMGIGLAAIACSRGYRCIIVMPDSMSNERRLLMKAYGAELILTPGCEGMRGCVKKAEELLLTVPHGFIPGQFTNPANSKAHESTTGPEIWTDLEGKVDAVVAGIGTGGTMSGIGKYLKTKNSKLKMIAVEPLSSPLISKGVAGPHKLQGIGANFVPEILDRDGIDEIICVSDDNAYTAAKDVAKCEGIFIGISSGAALWAATELAKRSEYVGKNIVVICPDTGNRYISTPGFID